MQGGFTIGGLVAERASLNDEITTIRENIDDGNTQEILDYIGSASYDYQLHSYLLGKSPGLSDTVLTALINKEPFVSDYVIEDVLTANAPITDKIWRELLNRQQPVAEYIVHDLALIAETIPQERQLDIINSDNNYSDWVIKDIFQHYSPLTDEVLIALLNRTPALAEWVIHDIFMVNTPLSQEVNNALLNRTPALQQWVVNNIDNSTFVADDPILVSLQVSDYKENQLQLEYFTFEKQKVEDELIRRYIFESDSINDYIDSILPLIEDTTRRENIIRQSDYYLIKDDTINAQSRLSMAESQDASLSDYAQLKSQIIENRILNNGCRYVDSCNTLKNDIDILAQNTVESFNEVMVAHHILKYINNEYGGEHFNIPAEMLNKSMMSENEDENQILNNDDRFEFTIYPNPASGSFHITFNQLTAEKIVVEDNTGKKVKSVDVKEMHHHIDLNYCAAGIYFVKVISEENEILGVKKLVLY